MGEGNNLHERATEILGKIMDLPKEEALKHIDELCGDDHSLKNEVLSLYSEFTVMPAKKEKSKPKTNPNFNILSVEGNTGFFSNLRSKLLSKKGSRLIVIFSLMIGLLFLGFFIRKQVYNSIFNDVLEERYALIQSNKLILNDWVNHKKETIQRYASAKIIKRLAVTVDSIDNLDLTTKEKNRLLQPYSNRLKEITRILNSGDLGILDAQSPRILLNTFLATDSTLAESNNIRLSKAFYDYYLRLTDGETIFFPPMHHNNLIYDGIVFYEESDCGFMTPIYDEEGKISAFLFFALVAQEGFTDIFKYSHYGKSSKTYAIDGEGRMASESRFLDDIKGPYQLDTLDRPTAIYYLFVEDPGANLMDGGIPDQNKMEREPTKIAKALGNHVFEGGPISGKIPEAYNDYRGVKVIGAYEYLPLLNIGIISEVDEEEAMSILPKIDFLLGILYVIICVSLFLLYHSNITLLQYNKRIKKLGEMGQYHLIDKIGEGGFGEVYKAEHSLLKMPVAIKLLKQGSTEDSIQRFEKEVKITSSLKHPNTIKVYDFGRSPQGQFYYVMEYINGITLSKILEIEKKLPIERIVYVLRMVCYSLREAHQNHLVHRDIKPLNIMLSQQGGAFDQVKLLDFGLVKDLESQENTQLHKIGGTPMFMAPERMRDPYNNDHRVDIYSIGALGLYLLSGRFLVELVSQKVMSGEETIQGNFRDKLIDREDVPQELKDMLLECIRFDPEKRVQHIDDFIDLLEQLQHQYPWTQKMAKDWWKTYDEYSIN
ncbi:protein kinase [Flammeovirga yaeyamensis]|uniref:Protein kinase n=1 Tax=Flammeovirga yaeyamensis TaxID=367791 RepID=A0AAX1NB88_9BACT|nr:serine/threonine-protein kinase [Flammeovirga yaeyamensis]MBB3697270.1 RIO-like serine/threonine protein kinase [Flammeovirga yaeyamensis]NMF33927.1 serine/threonine protein kinase [Flammeovirga yaeyamensis]QWG04813.1 protein kinase [Flammeovirga yaeyamensis]